MTHDISSKVLFRVLWEDGSQPLIMADCTLQKRADSQFASDFFHSFSHISVLHTCQAQSCSRYFMFLLHETLFCRRLHGSFSHLSDASIFYVFSHFVLFQHPFALSCPLSGLNFSLNHFFLSDFFILITSFLTIT